ncbi:WD40 repeat domain-containing protein [Saccharothrix stipae]
MDAPTLHATATEHGDAINRLAISTDGHTVAPPSNDGTTRIWDITDPKTLVLTATLTNHSDAVNAAAFSPDGRTLITGSADATVRLRPLRTDTAAEVCARARKPISTSDWTRHFPDLPHRPPCP